MTLQNHPGDLEFPVRPRGRHARAADARRRQSPREAGRRGIGLTAVAVPFGLAGLLVVALLRERLPDPVNAVVGLAAGMVVGVIVGGIVWRIHDARGPVRAQQHYLRLADRAPLTLRQQQWLALDAVSDLQHRLWNSSLAFMPTWIELPDDLRRRHADGATGGPWPALPMTSLDDHRGGLDEQFAIVSATDVELLVADVLSTGPVSARFVTELAGPHADRRISRIAALAEVSPFDVLALSQPGTDGRATLLLAGDIEHAIGATRYAYVAGYLTADEAWTLIGRLGDRAFAHYDGWDAYWRDVQIALAFGSDSLNTLQHHRASVAELRASSWRAARLGWPTAT